MISSLKMTSLGAILTIERNVTDAREAFISSMANHLKIKNRVGGQSKGFGESENVMLARRESYLNAMDRLCACIIRKLIPEKEAKLDYMQSIIDTVRTHQEVFGDDSQYENIKKVYDLWNTNDGSFT